MCSKKLRRTSFDLDSVAHRRLELLIILIQDQVQFTICRSGFNQSKGGTPKKLLYDSVEDGISLITGLEISEI